MWSDMIRNITYHWVMSHVNESCHISMSHVTCQWVTTHINVLSAGYDSVSLWGIDTSWLIHPYVTYYSFEARCLSLRYHCCWRPSLGAPCLGGAGIHHDSLIRHECYSFEVGPKGSISAIDTDTALLLTSEFRHPLLWWCGNTPWRI